MSYGDINIYIQKDIGGEGKKTIFKNIVPELETQGISSGINASNVNIYNIRMPRPPKTKSTWEKIKPAIIQIEQRALRDGVNMYGEISGNMVTANRANNFINASLTGLMAITNPVALIGVLYSNVSNMVSGSIDNIKANKKAEFLASGLGKVTTKYGRYY